MIRVCGMIRRLLMAGMRIGLGGRCVVFVMVMRRRLRGLRMSGREQRHGRCEDRKRGQAGGFHGGDL